MLRSTNTKGNIISIQVRKFRYTPSLFNKPMAMALGGEAIGVINPPILAEKGMARTIPFRNGLPKGTKASREPVRVTIMAVVAVLLIHIPNKVVIKITPNKVLLGERPKIRRRTAER